VLPIMSPNQLRSAGIAALAKSLGPVGMAKFIQQFDLGKGDYTKERGNWLGQPGLDKIFSSISEVRKAETAEKNKLP